jgi:hypothetical protein
MYGECGAGGTNPGCTGDPGAGRRDILRTLRRPSCQARMGTMANTKAGSITHLRISVISIVSVIFGAGRPLGS